MGFLSRHKVSVAVGDGKTVTAVFLAPTGMYADTTVQTATGVSPVVPTDNLEEEPTTKVAEVLKTGVVQRFTAVSELGNKKYRLQILCASDKTSTVEDNLAGAKFLMEGKVSNGANFIKLINPRRATFY